MNFCESLVNNLEKKVPRSPQKKEKKKKITVISGFLSGRNLAKTPPLTFLGQSQPVVGSMWKNEQFFGDLNFHKSEPSGTNRVKTDTRVLGQKCTFLSSK